MPKTLAGTAYEATKIEDGFAEHAAWQAMDTFIEDWTKALRRIERQRALLINMRQKRKAATERGDWPPTRS